jgi:hypothetical protein
VAAQKILGKIFQVEKSKKLQNLQTLLGFHRSFITQRRFFTELRGHGGQSLHFLPFQIMFQRTRLYRAQRVNLRNQACY